MARSQREKDMARRQKARPARTADKPGRGAKRFGAGAWIAIAVAVALIGVIGWQLAQPTPEPAVGREANLAAFKAADDPYLGDPLAGVVIIGFESPHCSSCKFFHNNLLPALRADYLDPGDAVLYYVQGTIGGDYESSLAQECVYRHAGADAFWSLTSRLYARSNTYVTPDWDAWLDDVAATYAADAGELQQCFHDGETAGAVSEDWRVAEDMGARGTPSFFIFGPEGEATRIASSQLYDAVTSLVLSGSL